MFDRRLFDQLVSAVPGVSPVEATPDAADLIPYIDLTTLNSTDDSDAVRRLCDRAMECNVAAVCVFPRFVPEARKALMGSDVRLASVLSSFPHGQDIGATRSNEIRYLASEGVDELDVVIRSDLALAEDWSALHADISSMHESAEGRTLKVILSTGVLGEPRLVYRAAIAAMLAGADFIKTSTGKDGDIADLDTGRAMLAAIGRYRDETGGRCGFKAAGGIRDYKAARTWFSFSAAIYGPRFDASEFRIGASSLLNSLLDETGNLPASNAY